MDNNNQYSNKEKHKYNDDAYDGRVYGRAAGSRVLFPEFLFEAIVAIISAVALGIVAVDIGAADRVRFKVAARFSRHGHPAAEHVSEKILLLSES